MLDDVPTEELRRRLREMLLRERVEACMREDGGTCSEIAQRVGASVVAVWGIIDSIQKKRGVFSKD